MLGRMLQATHYLHAVGVVSSPSHHGIFTYTFVWGRRMVVAAAVAA